MFRFEEVGWDKWRVISETYIGIVYGRQKGGNLGVSWSSSEQT